MAVYKVSNMAL